ncbi:MAG: hypothetical protein JEZ06_09940 [Anaerolineaceae bacterium]|nr:hypothetical protein [Anaerolineaceae bacterium]
MSNQSQDFFEQSAGGSNYVSNQPEKKSKKKLWLILGIVGAVLCLCVLIVGAVLVFGVGTFGNEQSQAKDVIHGYMQDMANQEVKSAYDRFSPRAQRQFKPSDLGGLVKGKNHLMFAGYEDLSINEFAVSQESSEDKDLAQGTVAEAIGELTFSDGYTGEFEAILEKVEDDWMLHYININVPPEKIGE